MADQQIMTRGVRRSAAPTVRIQLPTTRSAAVAADMLQNLIIDQSAQARPQAPQQQMVRSQQRPPQFAQRAQPQQQRPQNLMQTQQGIGDQIKQLLILQNKLQQDAGNGELMNNQGGQAGRDVAGSLMGRTVNEGTAVGKYGTMAAKTLGNMALGATLGPVGAALAGVLSRNLTNDDPAAIAADATVTLGKQVVNRAIPQLGLISTLASLFKTPDPVKEVEKVAQPVVKKIIKDLTAPVAALPAPGEGAINSSPTNPDNTATGSWSVSDRDYDPEGIGAANLGAGLVDGNLPGGSFSTGADAQGVRDAGAAATNNWGRGTGGQGGRGGYGGGIGQSGGNAAGMGSHQG